jgi:hypothetical protein
MQPALSASEQFDGLWPEANLLFQFTVHRLFRTLTPVHASLRKLPRIAPVDAPTPKDLIVGITNDNADVGSKTLAVDDALVVYHMLQVHFPNR